MRNPNRVAAEQEENMSKVGELTAVTVQPLESKVIISHSPFQDEQEEDKTGGKEEKEGNEGKGWQEWVLEGLEVTGDPLVPTLPRDLHPPHPRPCPHLHLHLLRRIILQQHRRLVFEV